jgi:hypothetical protein
MVADALVRTARPEINCASVYDTAPRIVAALCVGPRRASDLRRECKASRATFNRWIAAFSAAGVIVGELDPEWDAPGLRPMLWRLNVRRAS